MIFLLASGLRITPAKKGDYATVDTEVDFAYERYMERERYIYEILRSLSRHNGKARLNPTIYDEVLEAVRSELGKRDFLPVPSRSERKKWQNDIRQARRTMIEHGLMKRKQIHGIWEIDKAARDYLRAYPNVKLWETRDAKGNSFVFPTERNF